MLGGGGVLALTYVKGILNEHEGRGQPFFNLFWVNLICTGLTKKIRLFYAASEVP